MPQQQGRGNPFKSMEFVLVFALLVGLLISMLLIFLFVSGDDAAAVQTGRKDLLAIILGAFGAWIGAGAAYFFGRENLNAATESMLRMRGASPQERLMQTALRDMRLKPIPKTFLKTDRVGTVLDWIDEDQERFFVVVLDDKGGVYKTVHEEAIHRYLRKEMTPKRQTDEKTGQEIEAPGRAYLDVKVADDLSKVFSYIDTEVGKLESNDKYDAAKSMQALINAAEVIEDGQTAFVANDKMEREKKRITIVVDAKRVPLGYITTGDIRRLVLSLPS